MCRCSFRSRRRRQRPVERRQLQGRHDRRVRRRRWRNRRRRRSVRLSPRDPHRPRVLRQPDADVVPSAVGRRAARTPSPSPRRRCPPTATTRLQARSRWKGKGKEGGYFVRKWSWGIWTRLKCSRHSWWYGPSCLFPRAYCPLRRRESKGTILQ